MGKDCCAPRHSPETSEHDHNHESDDTPNCCGTTEQEPPASSDDDDSELEKCSLELCDGAAQPFFIDHLMY